MPEILNPFPDAELVLRVGFATNIGALAEVDGVWHTGSALPEGLIDRLPFALVRRIGGPRTRLQDNPILDVETYAPTRDEAVSLDGAISDYLLGYPRVVEVAEGTRVVIDSVSQPSVAVELPWDDSNIRRFMSTYQLSVRRR